MWACRLIGLLCCCLPLTVFSFVNQITELHVRANAAHCQVEFDATAPIHYQLIALSNPDRLVVDVENAHLIRFFDRSMLQGSPIKDIRSGPRDNNKLRIVFDLKNQVNTQATLLPSSKHNPYYRLHLDLTWQSPVAPTKKRPKYEVAYQRPVPVVLSPPSRSDRIVVVIDPGHGGKDPGATGPNGAHEKDIVLQISRDLQSYINRQPGFHAYLTRDGDYYLTLRQRLAIARHYKADMFIAIHADAYHGSHAYGASVFALSQRGATSEAARWLAKNENESELMGGVDLTDKNNLLKSVLINLSQTATIHASLNIGQQIIQALGDVGALHHHRIEQAAFVVLKSPDIPSLLVETGFITNPREERKLVSWSYQQHLADALTQGIRTYFVHSPPQGTWLARRKFEK
jgi:N-acetylmuramoyl-L-alanine amidase